MKQLSGDLHNNPNTPWNNTSNHAHPKPRAIVIYDTKYGNTKTLAKALTVGITNHGVPCDCCSITDVAIDQLVHYTFLAIGGPTQMAGMSQSMKQFLNTLQQYDLRGKTGFCFDTRVASRLNRFDLNSAAKRIEKRLKRMCVTLLKKRQSALVLGREGPLDHGVEQRFEGLGVELGMLLQ
jgi:flavorubredoxin